MVKRHDVVAAHTLLGDCRLTFTEIRGEKSGPTLGIISGIHGNEYSNIDGHLRFLEEVKALSPDKIAGRIISLPFVNLAGLRRGERECDGDNLNRIFPGNNTKTLAHRIIKTAVECFRKHRPNLIVDLHTMITPLTLSHVVLERDLNASSLKQRVLSCADMSGLAAVWLPAHDMTGRPPCGSSMSSFLKDKIPAFGVEVPDAPYSPSEGAEITRQVLWNMLYGLKMTKQNARTPWQHHMKSTLGIGNYHWRVWEGGGACHEGLFRRHVSVGQYVKSGEIVGEIINAVGDVAEYIQAQVSGYIARIAEKPFVTLGEHPFLYFTREPAHK